MKKLMFLMLAGSLVLGGCKKGCTDSKATNYDEKAKKDDGSCTLPVAVEPEPEPIDPTDPTSDTEKPVVSIATPAANAKVNAGEVLKISVSVTDNGSAASWMYTITDPNGAEATKSGVIALGKTTSEVGSEDFTIPASADAGIYTLSIIATDAAGNVSDPATVDIEVVTPSTNDTEKPTVKDPKKTFPTSGTNIAQGMQGTKGAKFDIEVSDNVEIDMVTVILYNTTQSKDMVTKEFKDVGKDTFKENVHLQYTGDVGDKAKIKVIAKDKAGNETEILSVQEYDLTLS